MKLVLFYLKLTLLFPGLQLDRACCLLFLKVIPNLHSLHAGQFTDFHQLELLSHQLTSLTLSPMFYLEFNGEMSRKVLDTLCKCSHLTHLIVMENFFTQSEECERLLSSLPALINLEFDQIQPKLLRSLKVLTSTPELIANCGKRIQHLKLRSKEAKMSIESNDVMINALRHFKSLHTLDLTCEGRGVDRVHCLTFKSRLEDQTIIPNLQRLVIEYLPNDHMTARKEADRFRFVYDREKRVNAGAYRVSDARSLQSTSKTFSSAQTLPLDLLHSIFPYLHPAEWLSSSHTCRSWYSSASSATANRCRRIALHLSSIIPLETQSPLRSHLTSLIFSPTCYLPLTQITRLMRNFPYLQILHVHMGIGPVITIMEEHAEEHRKISSRLRKLRVEFAESNQHDIRILLTVLKNLTRMTSLELTSLPYAGLSFRALPRCGLLRSLRLHYTEEVRGKLDFVARVKELHALPVLTALDLNDSSQSLIHWINAISTSELIFSRLQDFNLDSYSLPEGILPKIVKAMPNITSFHPANVESPADISCLVELKSLKSLRAGSWFTRAWWCDVDTIASLISCSYLTHICFPEPSSTDFTMERVDHWIDLFSQCTRLKSLELTAPYSFRLLSSFLPSSPKLQSLVSQRLLHLHLTLLSQGDDSNMFENLALFTSLTSLELHKYPLLPSGPEGYGQLYARFDCTDESIMILPNLKRLVLELEAHEKVVWDRELRINTEIFRKEKKPQADTIAMPPAPRLVGIELHPGPMNVTAGTLFNDGVHCILAFLDDRSGRSAALVCNRWHKLAASCATFALRGCSALIKKYSGAGYESLTRSPAFPSHSLRTHITTVDIHTSIAITVEEMNHIFISCSSVTTFFAHIDRFQIAVLSSPEVQADELLKINFPSTLTSLTLDIDGMSAAGTKSLMSQLADFDQLSHFGLKGRWNWHITAELHQLVGFTFLRSLDFARIDHLAWSNVVLPQLHAFLLTAQQEQLEVDQLRHMISVAPNLRSLHPPAFRSTLEDFFRVEQLHRTLTSLSLPHMPFLACPTSDMKACVLRTVSKCIHLTHLTFVEYFFDIDSDCERLLSALSQLTSLSFDQPQSKLVRSLEVLTSTPALIAICNERITHLKLQSRGEPAEMSMMDAHQKMINAFNHFTDLHTLIFTMEGPMIVRADILELKARFDDTRLMPHLQRLMMEHKALDGNSSEEKKKEDHFRFEYDRENESTSIPIEMK